MLELKNISVHFSVRGAAAQVVKAVDNVSLTVNDGEIYGIIGLSGAGKSTLVRTVNLLTKPQSGEVLINGKHITGLSDRELRTARQKIGMVFQHFNLAHSRTIFDNIALPLKAAGKNKKEIAERVPELLKLVNLSDKIDAYPNQLSGGQKQRVGIARALANEPTMLLCDEPTSALDLDSTDSILDLLESINRNLGVTILIITHEMAVVKKICHRVAVMQDGKIAEENELYELFSNPVSPLAKQLVSKSLNIDLPPAVIQNAKGKIYRITYLGANAMESVLSETISKHGANINILHGRIEYIHNKPIGILIVTISGNPASRSYALEYLKSNVAKLEEIANG